MSFMYYHVSMEGKKSAIGIALLTLIVYFLTAYPGTRPYVNSLFLLYIFVSVIGIVYWPFARKDIKDERLLSAYFVAVFASMLLWIGVTGWFFSPFFYLLYLLAIMLAFMYSTTTTFVFVIILIGLFSPNIGSIDLTVDIITIISLFSVVPLTYFLQREYLQLKQAEKKVLILEKTGKNLKNKVDEVLLNKVNSFAVNLRQPVNDMRQMSLVAQKAKSKKKVDEALEKIAKLGEETLNSIEKFEEEVTGKKLVHTTHKKKSSRKKKK